jgi:L-glyceraldehyde reductase
MLLSVVDDPLVVDIAKKLKKDPAQVLISWAVQRGSAVLPKSVTSSRIESNFQGICVNNVSVPAILISAIDFVIPDAEFEAINKLDRNERYNYPFRWGVDIFGELGAAEAERRAEEHAIKLRKGK